MTTLLPTPGVSAAVGRQIAVLRAGIELLSRVGDAAALYLTVSPAYAPRFPLSLHVQVTPGTAAEADLDTAKLAGIRAVAAILDGTLTASVDGPDWLILEVTGVTVAGVRVEIYTYLGDPEVIAAARALCADLDTSADR
ncbi:hypothetical protein [Frankia sp. BMG5.23]|uniref:hypothetical protein n=1 Tax=Frankia sp. BMG5.23 TaxID=683305 RepID=UPI0004611260|nr:hypothetical protein [Frankia sp. BMG5.23]KDA44974.1 hypothetical protein BMG523Draft_00099 [Frankia sp. BMG5.23]